MSIKKSTVSKKLQVIIDDLSSNDELKFSKAIDLLKTEGKASIIPNLVKLFNTNLSEKNKKELVDVFCTINDSDAIEVMIELLRNETNSATRIILLNSIWNSKLDYSAYLPDFVLLAAEGDFMEALECLTIIENLDGPFAEQLTLESQLHLKEYLEDDAPKDPQKAQIMSEIALFLKDFIEMGDEDEFFYEN